MRRSRTAPQDIEQAKKLLAEAGYGPGKLKVVFKTTTNYPYHIEASQIMVEWFREAGIEMTIEQLTWADWLSQVWTNKDFEISMMNFFTLWEPDFLYYSLWHSTGAFNYRHISDPVIDELVTKARVTVDPVERGRTSTSRCSSASSTRCTTSCCGSATALSAPQPTVAGLDTIVHPNGSNLNFHKVWLKA